MIRELSVFLKRHCVNELWTYHYVIASVNLYERYSNGIAWVLDVDEFDG